MIIKKRKFGGCLHFNLILSFFLRRKFVAEEFCDRKYGPLSFLKTQRCYYSPGGNLIISIINVGHYGKEKAEIIYDRK